MLNNNINCSFAISRSNTQESCSAYRCREQVENIASNRQARSSVASCRAPTGNMHLSLGDAGHLACPCEKRMAKSIKDAFKPQLLAGICNCNALIIALIAVQAKRQNHGAKQALRAVLCATQGVPRNHRCSITQVRKSKNTASSGIHIETLDRLIGNHLMRRDLIGFRCHLRGHIQWQTIQLNTAQPGQQTCCTRLQAGKQVLP